MFCKNCASKIQDNAQVCTNCGVNVGEGNKFCMHCGNKTNEEAEICVNCGVRIKNTNLLGGGMGRSKLVAILLCIFTGYFGIHRFYLGDNTSGFIMLALTIGGVITCGVTSIIAAIWVIIDLILLILDKIADENGKIPKW